MTPLVHMEITPISSLKLLMELSLLCADLQAESILKVHNE